MTATDRSTCKPWCTQHDTDMDLCRSDFRFASMSLETPVVRFGETRPDQMQTRIETDLDGQPVIVTFRESGTTMTPQEAAQYAVQLWELAAVAQAAIVRENQEAGR